MKDKPSFYTPRALAIEDQLKEEQDEEIENELRLLAEAILKANQVLRAYEEKKQIKLSFPLNEDSNTTFRKLTSPKIMVESEKSLSEIEEVNEEEEGGRGKRFSLLEAFDWIIINI